MGGNVYVFFVRQKTAYEIWYGIVGSEKCRRDRNITAGKENTTAGRETLQLEEGI